MKTSSVKTPELNSPLHYHRIALPKRSDLHLARKGWHMLTGCTGLTGYFFSAEFLSIERQTVWAYSLIAVAVMGFLVDSLRIRFESLNEIVLKFMGPFMRASEQKGYSGLPFYALGVGLSLFFFEEKIAILSTLFLIFADPIASLFGIIYGKDKILPNKSLQGVMACFFTCYILSMGFVILHAEPQQPFADSWILFAVISGIIGALAEVASTLNIDDNLTIPLVSGLGMTVANYYLHVF
jgi:diacylglycerol kinase (CTP)